MAAPEMKAKYKECREAEAQLASVEQKLGKSFCSKLCNCEINRYNMAAPEMKAKYKECREVEAQLASLEQKLGKTFVVNCVTVKSIGTIWQCQK